MSKTPIDLYRMGNAVSPRIDCVRPKTLTMNLSPKAIRFIVEALEYRTATDQKQLDVEDLDGDEVSDITNDTMFVESLLQELKKVLETPTSQVF